MKNHPILKTKEGSLLSRTLKNSNYKQVVIATEGKKYLQIFGKQHFSIFRFNLKKNMGTISKE